MEKTFGLIGGDRRQAELSHLLAADGNTVHTYGLNTWKPVGASGLEQAAGADVVILPLPLCRGDGVLNCEEGPVPTRSLFRRLRPAQRVLAGQVKPQQRREAADRGLVLEDYFLREELTVANAAATAEGAIQVAMERLDETLLGMECLVLGFGRIGQAEGRVAKALGMKVLAYDVYPNDSGREIAEYVDLDALLARSDVITLHCNLTPENTGMINKTSIAKMKDGVILINNARGQLIHEQDVADALNSGKMGAAGLDVVYTEPIRANNPLLQAKNCIITPHISWAPKESRQRIMDCAVSNVKAYLDGKPVNVVNLK